MKKKIILYLLGFLLLATPMFLYFKDIAEDRNHDIKITKPVGLYEDWETIEKDRPIGVVSPFEPLSVVRIRYGKDYMAIRVEKADKTKGWVLLGEGVELKSYNK